MKKSILLVLLAIAIVSSACAPAEAPAAEEEQLKVALIIAQGGLGDKSWNDLGNEGFQRAITDFGIDGTAVESEDPVGEGEKLMRTAAESGYNLVVSLEYSHADAIQRLAPDYPDSMFAIVGNPNVEADNVVILLFKEHEGSFLAGAISGMVTTMENNPKVNPDKVLGAIQGVESPGFLRFTSGFLQGAQYIDPEIELLIAIAGSFNDPSKGRELAISQYEQGADIVYQIAGGTGEGVFTAAEEMNHYAVGVDQDQDGQKPGYILTSMIKRVDVAVYEVIKKYSEGTLEGGTTIEYGLKEDGVGISPMTHTKDQLPAEFFDELEEIKQKILSGEIEVVDPLQTQ